MSAIDAFVYWGDSIDTLLWKWESLGIFDYFLPFLLVFTIVYAILQKTKILGDEKGINLIIGLVVGVLTIYGINNYYPVGEFFKIIFPKMGIGLAVLLVILILMGLFLDWRREGSRTILMVVTAVITLIVILTTFSSQDWMGSYFWQNYLDLIVIGIIIVIILIIILSVGKGGDTTKDSVLYKFIPGFDNKGP